MSTRGLTGFKLSGRFYVTYNHSDSYPEWLGQKVLEFCHTITNWDEIKYRVGNLRLVDESDHPTQEEIHAYHRYANTSVGNQKLTDWYCLLRELQGVRILEEVWAGHVGVMIDNSYNFQDSLFMEWAYVINLDDMTLDVYKGNNRLPVKDMDCLPDYIKNEPDHMGYYPARKLHSYSLSKLPKFMLGVTNKFKSTYASKHAKGDDNERA